MSTEEGLLVRKIREGTVIDHISAGKGFQVVRLLGLEGSGYTMAVVSNVESKKLGKKDIVKVEGLFLTSEQINLVSLVAPNATLNIIREGNVVLKQKVRPPEVVEKILPCPNSSCITRKKGEYVLSRMTLVSSSPLLYKCAYCGTYVGEGDIAKTLL
ncbi:MAG: aspartate carbamoyltransferase regulatory subunit [Acidilobaceae archaeon]|nr:aspartate carbamoyltransferase regulatory subunit [Acidilobaceae archaeon]MCX8165572.1 aspartate carbamoyltransferase regulatory subunit [Acidilobaceae archaeon]MDW7973999.1 aspartate carbamoyltransferase regulatory subunit [Sulfolobales archaeon]